VLGKVGQENRLVAYHDWFSQAGCRTRDRRRRRHHRYSEKELQRIRKKVTMVFQTVHCSLFNVGEKFAFPLRGNATT